MLRRIHIKWAELPHFQPLEKPFPVPERIHPGIDQIDPATFPDFLDEIGLVGMGGGGFPTGEKIRLASGAHTLVINGIECEPGVTIDQAVLLHEAFWVAAGAHAVAQAIGAKHILLATKDDPAHLTQLSQIYPDFKTAHFSDPYPAGAEKLILKKLLGKTIPPGKRPYEFGYLVQNAVTLRAIGRAIVDGIPVVERPLTLAFPTMGFYKNIIVPIGYTVRDVLAMYDLKPDPTSHFIASSGVMMGHEVGLDDLIEKTTLSLLILKRDDAWRDERPCIRCGACNSACPLGLHPFTLTEKIRKAKTRSPAFKAQMTECFLCGVCSAVCPSDIPLVQHLQEGKQCL